MTTTPDWLFVSEEEVSSGQTVRIEYDREGDS